MEEPVVNNKVDHKAHALLFIGASLYWPLLRRSSMFFSLGGHDATNLDSLFWLSIFLLLCTVCVTVCCAVEKRAQEIIERRGNLVLLVFGLQAICKTVEEFLSPDGIVGGLIALVDVALYAFSFVLLTYMWAAWYLPMNRREVVAFSSATFAASFIVSDMVRLLPQWIDILLFSLFPFASAFIWVAYRRAGHPHIPVPDAGGSTDSPLTWSLVAVLAAFLLVGGLVRGAMTTVVDGSLVQIQPVMDIITSSFGIALFVFSLLYRSSSKFLINAWSVAVTVFFAGLLFTMGFSGDSVERGRQTVIVGRTCLDLIYWIVLIELVRDAYLSPIRAIGVWFVLVDIMSSLVGYIVAPMVLVTLGVEYEVAAVPLAAVTAFILIIASILFFSRVFGSSQTDGLTGVQELRQMQEQRLDSVQHPGGLTRENDAQPTDPASEDPLASAPDDPTQLEAQRTEHVDSVLAEYRLSERELEVAELLANGNSQKKIAEALYLSLGTVQSHIKSIYRKLDIHSRQELIDMMRR